MKDTTNILIAFIALVSAATVRAASPDAKQIVSMQAGNFTLPDTIEMVRIPAGTFIMGSPKDELGRGEDETARLQILRSRLVCAICEEEGGRSLLSRRHVQHGSR